MSVVLRVLLLAAFAVAAAAFPYNDPYPHKKPAEIPKNPHIGMFLKHFDYSGYEQLTEKFDKEAQEIFLHRHNDLRRDICKII